jgi:flagellar biosynthesis/type III secretory pathway chaperone
MTIAWETELTEFLTELSAVQDELLSVLASKRECMSRRDAAGMQALNEREALLGDRLQAIQSRRGEMLATARKQGMECDNLQKLAKLLPAGKQAALVKQMKDAAWRTRLLQHQSLTNWVIAQRSVLHLSQMIEIIATGGRLRPTYGKSDAALARGALVDQEA